MAKTKKLDRAYVEHVAGLLRPILTERFGGNVTHMAKEMKVSQPSLQALMQGSERGVGIVFLLAVRSYLRDKTLDEILGLDPPEFVRLTDVEVMVARALEKRLGPTDPTDDPEPARLLPASSFAPARRKRS